MTEAVAMLAFGVVIILSGVFGRKFRVGLPGPSKPNRHATRPLRVALLALGALAVFLGLSRMLGR